MYRVACRNHNGNMAGCVRDKAEAMLVSEDAMIGKDDAMMGHEDAMMDNNNAEMRRDNTMLETDMDKNTGPFPPFEQEEVKYGSYA